MENTIEEKLRKDGFLRIAQVRSNNGEIVFSDELLNRIGDSKNAKRIIRGDPETIAKSYPQLIIVDVSIYDNSYNPNSYFDIYHKNGESHRVNRRDTNSVRYKNRVNFLDSFVGGIA